MACHFIHLRNSLSALHNRAQSEIEDLQAAISGESDIFRLKIFRIDISSGGYDSVLFEYNSRTL